MSEDSGLTVPADWAGPSGVAPGEKVPNQVRMAASQHNLGNLSAVHRPSTWLGRIQFRNGRVYRYDRGLVLCQSDGARLKLFPLGQVRIRNTKDRTFLLAGPGGQAGLIVTQWTDGAELAKSLSQWALTAPWR